MRTVVIQPVFEDWRRRARELLALRIPPDQVLWSDDAQEPGLFAPPEDPTPVVINDNDHQIGTRLVIAYDQAIVVVKEREITDQGIGDPTGQRDDISLAGFIDVHRLTWGLMG